MPKNVCPPVGFITYSSTITGGKALREMNSQLQNELYGQSLNYAGRYSQLYDKAGKHNETFYDLLSSQIALLNPEDFDNYFSYCPVILTESGSNLNGFHPSQFDPLKFKMTSTTFNGYTSFTRDYFDKYLNYSNPTTEHVFIYGPITDFILQNLIDKINTTISHKTKLIIHFQGENTLDNEGKEGDMVFGMKSKGNLFCNSFNYQNCMRNSQKFRQFIQSNPECMSFTLISKNTPELLTNQIADKRLTDYVPTIYIPFYEHTEQLLHNSFTNNHSFYTPLNITHIFEDMVDKDNITALLFLLINNINLSNCWVYLIGREAYTTSHKGQEFPHHKVMNFSAIPDQIKPESITEEFKNIELVMSETNDCYWPRFKNPDIELTYNQEMTNFHYLLATELFKMALHNDLTAYNCTFHNYYCDFNNLIPNPSSTEQRLCLLNETLFYPYINALASVINQVDSSQLDKFDPKIKSVLNSKSYLSDCDLLQIAHNTFNKYL